MEATFGRSTASSASSSAEVTGPLAATSAITASTRCGDSRAARSIPPQASCSARAIRQRISRCVAGGTKDASWAQYSTSRRGAREQARSAIARGYAPSLLNSGR